jgi:hypothetical protein
MVAMAALFDGFSTLEFVQITTRPVSLVKLFDIRVGVGY